MIKEKILNKPMSALLIFLFCFYPLPNASAQVQAIPAADPDSVEMIAMEGSAPLASNIAGQPAKADESHLDHKATIVDFEGKARIKRNTTTNWQAAKQGMIINEGDELLTGKESYIDIAYDDKFLNIARIDANTVALFHSIEPTVLKLQDGTIFNALDGLPAGSQYKIATQTAVAAVRGTHFGVVALDGFFTDIAVTVDTKPHISQVDVTHFEMDQTFNVVEDSQLSFNDDGHEMGPVSDDMMDFSRDMMERMETLQDQLPVGDLPPVDLGQRPDQPRSPNTELGDQPRDPLGLEGLDDDRHFGDDGNPPNDGDPFGDLDGSDPLGSGFDPMKSTLGDPNDAPLLGDAPTSPDAAIDAMMDLLIPPDDLAEFKTPETEIGVGPDGPRSDSLGRNPTTGGEPRGEMVDPLAGGLEEPLPLEADPKAVSKFFGVGMGLDQYMNEGPGDRHEIETEATQIMQNFGYDPETAEQFGDFMGEYSEMSGNFATMDQDSGHQDGGDHEAGGPTPPMMHHGEGGQHHGPFPGSEGGDFPAGTEQFTPEEIFEMIENGDIEDLPFDINELIQDATDNENFEEEFFEDFFDPENPQGNPFEYVVRDFLEFDPTDGLTATEKALLISNGDGFSIGRGDLNFEIMDGDSNLEKLVNVNFVNKQGEVVAEYDAIVDDVSAGQGVIQPPNSGLPHIIFDVAACNPGDPESGGVCD